MIKLLGQIDSQVLIDTYNQLADDIKWQHYYHDGKQAGLQTYDYQNEWASIQNKNPPDSSYNILNSFFKNTYFEQLVNNFNMFRTRLIWLGSNTCYWFHKDKFPRVHFPIFTNEHAYFVFKNGSIEHLKVGYAYLVDTRLEHSAMNGADVPRLHLVGSVTNYT